jgi:hypothetical protein
LCPLEKPGAADILKKPVHIQGILVFDPCAKILYKVISSGNCIHSFAATPDILVGKYLYKDAAPDISAFDVSDLQIRGRGPFGCFFNRLRVTLAKGGQGSKGCHGGGKGSLGNKISPG